MDFGHYFDLTLQPVTPLPDSPPPSAYAPTTFSQMGRLVRLIHAASADCGIAFASAFPKWMSHGFTMGDVLRVFAASKDDAEKLYDTVESMAEFASLATGARIRQVSPAALEGPREVYLMHRISSGISKKGQALKSASGVMLSPEKRAALQAAARVRRMAERSHLPYLPMKTSAGHYFRLVIERVRLSAEDGDSVEHRGSPNGYGLSRATQLVGLPVVV